MEPADEQPDDLVATAAPFSDGLPQWSRLTSSRMTKKLVSDAIHGIEPQWSRLTSSRMTLNLGA